jgi:hypothetical protein
MLQPDRRPPWSYPHRARFVNWGKFRVPVTHVKGAFQGSGRPICACRVEFAQSQSVNRLPGGREAYSRWIVLRSLASAVILGVGGCGASLLSPNHFWQTAATSSGVMGSPLAIRRVKSSISGSYSSGGASSKTPRRS